LGRKTIFPPAQESERAKGQISFVYYPSASSAVISAANLAWVNAIHNIEINSESSSILKDYLFNVLYPPSLPFSREGIFNIWHEAPYLLVADRSIEIYTLHKTLCYLKGSAQKGPIKNFLIAKFYMLDSQLNPKMYNCLFPENSEGIREGSLNEAIVIKRIKIFDKASFRKPQFNVFVYPFTSSSIFSEDNFPGPLITALSIVLRHLYLRSSDPLRLNVKIEELREKVLSILRRLSSENFTFPDVASLLLQNPEGFTFAINSLGVYHAVQNDVLYLHPSLLECFSSIHRDSVVLFDKMAKNIRGFIPSIFGMVNFISHGGKLLKEPDYAMRFKEFVETETGINLDYTAITRFIGSLKFALEKIVPLSKHLFSPAYIR